MTVPATSRRAGPYSGNGSTTSFSFSFKTFAAGDLLVTKTSATGLETTLVLNSDYSVTLNGDQDASPGGSIAYPISGSALASGEKLTIVGDLAYEQTTDLLGGGAFNARVIEDTFDRTVVQIQQLEERTDRALTLPVSATASTVLPVPAAGKVIAWDSTASALVNVDSADLASTVAYANWRTDTFNGNGSTTQFTLAADPGNVNNLDIAIGGVVQTPTADYTVSGTTLTFTSAPPAGTANIVVRYGQALPVGTANASLVTFDPAGTGASSRTVQAKLRDTVSVKDFGAVGDGTTDDTTAIQAALNAGLGPVYFPPGVYIVTSEIVVPDGSGIIGSGAHWKRRTGYAYNSAVQTVFKYTGTGGSTTCVVRASNDPVGVQGTDFSTTGDGVTDDLLDVRLQDFHIDANNIAAYGLYAYRVGNQSTLGNVTAEKAKESGQIFLGCFAAYFGVFGSYSSEQKGFVVGDNVFSWSSDYQCYSFHAKLIAANNGTLSTFVEGSGTDSDGCGAVVRVGRGSKVSIGSEGNYGRSCIIGCSGSAGGPAAFELDYLEGNQAGPLIIYRPADVGMVVRDGFLYPRSPTGTLIQEKITIQARTNSEVVTTDEGPRSIGEWLILENLQGTSGLASFVVSSNTYRYRVRNCSGGITYDNKRPLSEGPFASGFFKADATLSDTRRIEGETRADVFTGNGVTDTFTLSANSTSSALTEVWVNGQLKTATTHYSVSGNSLVFVPAQIPANGVTITVKYSNMVLTRPAVGRYLLTWSTPQPDADYAVHVTAISSTATALVFIGSLSANSFEIRTAAPATPGTLADTGAFIDFAVSRRWQQ